MFERVPLSTIQNVTCSNIHLKSRDSRMDVSPSPINGKYTPVKSTLNKSIDRQSRGSSKNKKSMLESSFDKGNVSYNEFSKTNNAYINGLVNRCRAYWQK